MADQNPLGDHMQGRINNLFTGQDLPTPANLREVEAMKSRIRALEAQLREQTERTSKAEKEAAAKGPERFHPVKVVEPTISLIPRTSATGKSSWVSRVWDALTQANAAITDAGSRNSARLAASFLIIILLLEVIGGLARIPRAGLLNAFLGPIGFALLPTLFAYWLTRTKWYQAGVFVFSMTFSALAYVSMASEGAQADISALLLVYVPLSLVVASTFLSSAAVFLLTGLNVGALFLTLATFNIITPDNIGAQSGIITTIGFVLIALSNFRKTNERLRLENLRQINKQLEDSRDNLEQRVAERTHDLELATEIGRTITARVDNLSQLLSEAAESIRHRFDLYYTQVYLVDRAGRFLLLRAGTGDVGRQLLQRGHQLMLNIESLNGRAALEKRTIIVQDTQHNPNFLPNPLLPSTRSEMSIPLIVGDRVVGVLDMQSEQANALNEENLTAFEALAGQLAVAIQNSYLFEQVNQARKEVEEQSKLQSLSGWSTFLNGLDRNEKIGFVYNQNEVLPYVDVEKETLHENTLHAAINVAGAEIGKIYIADSNDRKWTPAEAAIIHNTSVQLSRHIENLRLLAQSEKYRHDAEEATRRLTREGWETFLNTKKETSHGFVYRENKVQPLVEDNPVNSAYSLPIEVRAEVIGELAVNTETALGDEATEILSAVALQLSSHLESLRLLEETEASRVEVQKSQEQYELAVEGSNDGLWDWNIETNNVYFSPRWKAMVGYEEHELMNGFADFESLLHPEDHDRVLAAVNDYLSGKSSEYDVEFRFRHKNGSYRWILARGKAMRRENGAPYRMAGSHTDISERKESEEAIKKAQEQYELAVEGSNDGLWDWNIETNNVYFSPRWKAMVGYEEHELMNGFADFESLLHPEDHDRVLAAVNDYLSGKSSEYDVEFRFRHKNGSYRWILARGKAMRRENGAPYRMAGSHTDISERKESEEAIKKAQEQYELAVEGSNDGLWDWNIETNNVYFSPRWKAMVGYEEHELMNGFADFESLLHPEDHDRVLAAVNDYLSGKSSEYDVEFRFRHKNGTYRWILARGKAMRRENGAPYRMAGSHTDISERKESEEAIKKAQEQYSLAVSGSNDGIWDWDIANEYIYYSPRWKNMLGYEEHELTRGFQDWEDLIHPEDHDRAVKALEDYLEQRAPEYDVEIRLQHKDGSWRWIRDRGKALRRPDGTAYRMAGSHSDITDRKLAEENIRTNEARLAEALEIARLGNWEYDVEKDIFTFNDHFYSIFKTTAEEVGGYQISSAQYAQKFVHPDDLAIVGVEIEKALNSKERLYRTSLEHRIIYSDGNVGHIAVSINVERDEHGKITRYYGANQDITERKRDEEIIAQRANQLETVATVSTTASTVLNPDELLQTVVDLTKERFGLYHVHIYLADESWSTLLLSAGAGEVGRAMSSTGHSIATDAPRSLVARAYRERQAVIVNDIHQDAGFLPNPLLPDTHSEMAVPMIVGEKVIGVFDAQSETAGFFTQDDALIFNTLASQVAVALQNARLYQEQAATVTQLRELDRLKSSFLANMSHELRTPLNSILGFTDVMLEGLDGDLTEYMDNDLRLIQKNGQHLLHLINDVLDMAKIESGRMNLNIETCNMNEVMEDVIRITSSLANEKNIALYIDPESDKEVEITVDRTRLRQVLINLVNNSIKFTDKGSVSVRAARQQENVLLCVKDTGIGIPPEHLESVFQEFTQVDTSTTRKAGGTGLGLPISRRLIEMHGGRLWGESTGIDGEGASFYVLLPLEAKVSENVAIEKV